MAEVAGKREAVSAELKAATGAQSVMTTKPVDPTHFDKCVPVTVGGTGRHIDGVRAPLPATVTASSIMSHTLGRVWA